MSKPDALDGAFFEQLVIRLLQRPIAFYPIFAEIAGTTDAGIMLSQAWYWTQRLDAERDGWFYKSWQEWQTETSLGRRQQDTAKAKLKSAGLIETRQEGLNRTLHFRIHRENFLSALKSHCTNPGNGMHNPGQSNAPNGGQQSTNPGNVHAENTSEITSKNTSHDSSANADGQPAENSKMKPVTQSKTQKPAPTKGKTKKAAPASPDDQETGPGNWLAPFIDAFSEFHLALWEFGYDFTGRDGKALKQARATHKDAFTPEAWQRACVHYFQSPARPRHTVWHLAENFVVYHKGRTDKFGSLLETEKPNASNKSETGNAIKPRPQSHGERAAANTFAVFAASAATWSGDAGIEGTSDTDEPVIDIGPNANFE